MSTIPKIPFTKELHKRFCLTFINSCLPYDLVSLDTNRAVILYFCVAGLDVLGETEPLPQENKDKIIEWLYLLQVDNNKELVSGFQGSSCLNTIENRNLNTPYKWAHLTHTYSTLLSLLILGDNLDRIDRKGIIESLKALQLPDGSFKAAIDGTENDMRFVFCAAAISYILCDWSGINVEKMIEFILKSISYDGGISQQPDLESHCGSTFCGLASLALSNNLDRLSKTQLNNLTRWLIFRLESGFSGRPNKPTDTCYSFWTGGALNILNAYHFIESNTNASFVLMTQDHYGGFSKWVNSVPDPMHTYLGLAGLSLMNYGDLEKLFVPLNCTEKVHQRLCELQSQWKQ